jgi:predicted kinase
MASTPANFTRRLAVTGAQTPPAGVLFVSGIPGVGKTTVARLIAGRMPRAAHIEGDAIHNLVVSGCLHPGNEPREEALRQLMLRERNEAALADNLAEAGFFPVIDDVVAYQERLERLLRLVRTRPAYMAVLAPPSAVALERDETRDGKTVAQEWLFLDEVIRSELAGNGHWLDTSSMDAEQTTNAVIDRVWSEGLVAE